MWGGRSALLLALAVVALSATIAATVFFARTSSAPSPKPAPTAATIDQAPRAARPEYVGAVACKSYLTTNGKSTLRVPDAMFAKPPATSAAHSQVWARTKPKPARVSRHADVCSAGRSNGRAVSASAVAAEATNVPASIANAQPAQWMERPDCS